MSVRQAFVTMATNDAYCMGATVVARSLRRHGTTRSIVVMVTPSVSMESRRALSAVFDQVVLVDLLDSTDHLRLSWLRRPELGPTFTKIHCWTLTSFSKGVFLDADTLVLANVDELFDREELSAAPDPGWPDCFNSGVFVFRPSAATHRRLVEHAARHGSFDGGDQGLLNSFFSDWSVETLSKHLPFIYNLSASSIYSYAPAFKQFGHDAKIIHFLGAAKPWSGRGSGSGSYSMEEFVSRWWAEVLGHGPSVPSVAPPMQDHQAQEQTQTGDAHTPFGHRLDSSNSLLAHFSTHRSTAEVDDTPLGAESENSDDATTGSKSQRPAHLRDEEEEKNEDEEEKDEDEDDEDKEEDEDEECQRLRWEAGHADYLGRDAFTNIQKMLDQFLDLDQHQ